MDSKAPGRAEIRKQEIQSRIAAAAVELFGELGVNDTSVVAIVKHAGIAHKTFFNHFPSKTHLMFYIANEYSGSSDAIFQHFIDIDCEPVEKLEKSFLTIAESLSMMDNGEQEMFKQIINGVQLGPENSKINQLSKLHKAIGKILEEAYDKEQLKPGLSIDIYLEMIIGLFVSSMLIWATYPDSNLEARMKRAITFIKHSVFK